MFFPERGKTQLVNDGLVFCMNCTVREECRTFRKETDSPFGVWGGELFTRKDKSEEDDS